MLSGALLDNEVKNPRVHVNAPVEKTTTRFVMKNVTKLSSVLRQTRAGACHIIPQRVFLMQIARAYRERRAYQPEEGVEMPFYNQGDIT
jgi:hypothetical protein